jgi:hypothetical protein
MLPDLLWTGTTPPVRLVPLPGDPVRDLFTAARAATSRESVRAVREALRDALSELVGLREERT